MVYSACMSEGFELRNKVPEQAFLKKEAEVVNGNPSDYYLCYSSEDRMVIALEPRRSEERRVGKVLRFRGGPCE